MKMALTGSPACIKYLLFIFNLIFVITGIAILCVGAVIQGVYHTYSEFLDDGFFSTPALLVATGSIILVIAFFGCCGAVKENHCMVVTFSVLLSIIFVLELAAGIAGYALEERTAEVLERKLGESIQSYSKYPDTAFLWDNMQEELRCCGIHNATDWIRILNNTGDLPMSCCKTKSGAIGSVNCTVLDLGNVYSEGCLDTLGDFVRDYAVTIGGVGISIAFIQLLGVVLACVLARSIRAHYESV